MTATKTTRRASRNTALAQTPYQVRTKLLARTLALGPGCMALVADAVDLRASHLSNILGGRGSLTPKRVQAIREALDLLERA